MKTRFFFPNLLLLGLMLASCSASRFANYADYDRTANLRSFESFTLIDSIDQSGRQSNPMLTSDFARGRFILAINNALVRRGYAASLEGALRGTVWLRSRNRTQSYGPAYSPMGFGFGMGGFGYNGGGNRSYEEVQLVLSLRDAATGHLIWQGLVAGSQDDFLRKPDKSTIQAVDKLFEKFPDGRRSRDYDPVRAPKASATR